MGRRSLARRSTRGRGAFGASAADPLDRGADLAVRARPDPRLARARDTSLVTGTRSPVATCTARSENGPRRWKDLVVGTPLHLSPYSLAARAGNLGTVAEGLRRVSQHRPGRGLLPWGVGL